MIENGRREPKLSLLQSIAAALGVPSRTCSGRSRRAGGPQLEIELDGPSGNRRTPRWVCPAAAGRRLPTDALETSSRLHARAAPARRRAERDAGGGPRGERASCGRHARAGQLLRRDRGGGARGAAGRSATTAGRCPSAAARHRRATRLLPALRRTTCRGSTRSVTDLRNRRIYLPQGPARRHDPRASCCRRSATSCSATATRGLRRLPAPAGRGQLLRRGAAGAGGRRGRVPAARRRRPGLSIEDIRDVFGVSYETAAHRFTNLATHHLGIPVHFTRSDEGGTIYKAYENDGVCFPTDVTGAIEGQPVCRQWSARQVFAGGRPVLAVLPVHRHAVGHLLVHGPRRAAPAGEFAVTVGVPYEHAAGSAAATPPGARCPAAPTRLLPPPAGRAGRGAGPAGPGRAPGRTRTCWRRCRRAPSRASTADVYEFLERRANG